jgi:glycerophosphoryl diester phosphodiesterase
MAPGIGFLNGLRRPARIAHRGGSALFPENTLPAFAGALRTYGADAIELDVHLSRDGALVVSHDESVDRCTDGHGAIAALDWATLVRLDAGYRFTPDGGQTFPFRGRGVRLPLLEEVLRAHPNARVNIELKPDHPDGVETLVRLLRRLDAIERVCIGSERDVVGERLAAALPEACHFYTQGAALRLALGLWGMQPKYADPRFQILEASLFYEGRRVIDRAFIEGVHSLGKTIFVWTVDDPAEMRRLREDGVDGVISDRPDLLPVLTPYE